MTTISQLLALHTQLPGETPRLDAEVLLSHVLEKPRSHLYTWPDKEIAQPEEETYTHLLSRRVAGEPIAHIIGSREFWSLPLLTNNSTLIPRPETEQLVEAALSLGQQYNAVGGPFKVLDLGTGTGAIALAIASEKPDWQITAVDKFEAAVELAEKNRQRLSLANVTVKASDWFAAVTGRFHIIVSNPPYIDDNDHHLTCGDVAYEPRTALVAKNHGFADIETIIAGAAGFLMPEGWLILEHGEQQAAITAELFAQAGFNVITTLQDLAGKDRITYARK